MRKSKIPLNVIFPLEFFYVPGKEKACLDGLEFDTQTCIREIAKDEEEVLEKHVSRRLFPSHRDLCLQVKTYDVRPPLEVIHPVISTLRLMKRWLVGINFYLVHDFPSRGDIEIYPINTVMEIFWSPWGPKRKSYWFGIEDVEVFNHLYKGCKEAISQDKRFRFAIARFNQSYSSKYFEDKLLDWVITLEAIFLTGESEKAFRLRTYMSIFLGETPEERAKIWAFVKKAYELRGKIVHNGAFLPRSIKMQDSEIPRQSFMDSIEDYVRASLKRYVKWKMTNRTLDFHRELDRSILIYQKKQNSP